MKKPLAIFVLLIGITSLSFGATLASINKDQFKQTFTNKTFTAMLASQINGKQVNNSIAVYIGDKGKISGKFADKPAKGPQADQGKYTIKNDGMVCITWQHWFNSKEECVYAYNTQNAYIMVDNNSMFHFSVMKFSIRSGNNLKNS